MTGHAMYDLFERSAPLDPAKTIMAEGAVLLRGAALPFAKVLLTALGDITALSPFRYMVTPGGYTMSVAMTNCGASGWVADRTGYRYDRIDPETVGCGLLLKGMSHGDRLRISLLSRRLHGSSL